MVILENYWKYNITTDFKYKFLPQKELVGWVDETSSRDTPPHMGNHFKATSVLSEKHQEFSK